MRSGILKALFHCLAFSLTACPGARAIAADLDRLPALNAAIGESSISGLSSGGFMAVQFGTAWSSIVKGVAAVSAGPFFCAQADVSRAMLDCMDGEPPPLRVSTDRADRKAHSEEIDSTANLARQQIYLFHGYNDKTVVRSVTDAAAAFYAHYLGDRAKSQLFYQTAVGAGHAYVVGDGANTDELGDCPVTRSPYIVRCGYDQAGIILRHIYGALAPPAGPGALSGAVRSFDQARYARPTPEGVSLAREGYLFVPKDCADPAGPACRVHIVLHGCLQGAGFVGRQLIDDAGFNAWADTNRIIVLYPQVAAEQWQPPFGSRPNNPQGCWDFWGYLHIGDDAYVTQSGPQIRAIKAMLDALTAGYRLAAAAAPTSGQAPAALVVNDVSDTAAALAWTPVDGAASYEVARMGPDGGFSVVGSTAASSFADTGLAARTSYRWRVTPIIDGMAGPPSAEVAACTRARPPRCDRPGRCEIIAYDPTGCVVR